MLVNKCDIIQEILLVSKKKSWLDRGLYTVNQRADDTGACTFKVKPEVKPSRPTSVKQLAVCQQRDEGPNKDVQQITTLVIFRYLGYGTCRIRNDDNNKRV